MRLQIERTVIQMDLWFTENHSDSVRFSIRVDKQLYSCLLYTSFIVEGSYDNIKLTTKEDIAMAEYIIGKTGTSKLCVGHGYDVHRLVELSLIHIWLPVLLLI